MRRMSLSFIFLMVILSLTGITRHQVIEDFNDSLVTLNSYYGDTNPGNWSLNMSQTYGGTPVSLYLNGNNSKFEYIDPVLVSDSTVWQFAAYKTTNGTMAGFGVGDGQNKLIYLISGTTPYDSVGWVSVYEGQYGLNSWSLYQMPIGQDWFARYDYYPNLDRLYYINFGNGKFYIDEIYDISEDIPEAPRVLASAQLLSTQKYDHYRTYTYQFSCTLLNPDTSLTYSYQWQFGDSTFSSELNPVHQYIITDTHPYTVLLRVSDSNGRITYASVQVDLEFGDSSFPLSINFIGDTMLGRNVNNSITTGGADVVFENVADVLSDADLTVANLESALTTAQAGHPTKTIVIKANPQNAQALNLGGIDLVTIANNHIYDYLAAGLTQTRNTLDQYGILYSGAGLNSYEAYQPLLINKKGVSLAFLASSDRTGSYNNYQPFLDAGYNKPGFAMLTPYYLQQQLESVENIADFKIVEMHAGSEYSLMPGSDYDKNSSQVVDESEIDDSAPKIDYPHMWDNDLRHYAVDQGADIVIVHHPHIIQGFEMYNNKLIAHSLGNFVFDLTRADCKPTMILKTKLKENGFYEYEVVPAYLDGYFPKITTGKLANKILDYLSWRSMAMNTYLVADRINNIGKIITDTVNIPHEHLIFSTDLSLEQNNNVYQSKPYLFDHTGYLYRINQISPAADWFYRAGRSCMWFGDFENTDYDQWNTSVDGVFDNQVFYSGNNSLRITDNPPAENCSVPFRYKLRRMSNGSYGLTAKVKIENGQSASIKITYYSSFSNDDQIVNADQTITLPVNTNGLWEDIYQELTVPENCMSYNITLQFRGTGSSVGKAWFDDVDIIEWDEWRAQSDNLVANPNAYYFLQVKNTQGISSASIEYEEKKYYDVPVNNDNPEINQPILTVWQNYPNPFNPSTSIGFNLKKESPVKVDVYNIKGQKVKNLIDTNLQEGHHTVVWNGTNKRGLKVGSGIYFYKITAGQETQNRKMILVK